MRLHHLLRLRPEVPRRPPEAVRIQVPEVQGEARPSELERRGDEARLVRLATSPVQKGRQLRSGLGNFITMPPPF